MAQRMERLAPVAPKVEIARRSAYSGPERRRLSITAPAERATATAAARVHRRAGEGPLAASPECGGVAAGAALEAPDGGWVVSAGPAELPLGAVEDGEADGVSRTVNAAASETGWPSALTTLKVTE
jgi:hypothetical protein